MKKMLPLNQIGVLVLLLTAFSFLLPSCKRDTETESVESGTPSKILITQTINVTHGACEVLDTLGNLVYTKNFTTIPYDFREWNINGVTRYTCQLADPNGYNIPTVTGHIPCADLIMDSNYNELTRVMLLPYNGRTATDPNDLDVHDFILLGDNHYIAEAYYETTVNNIPSNLHPVPNCKVAAPIIQEVENGAVVWEWDGANDSDLYTASVEGNAFYDSTVVDDYAHLNAMIVDPKDNNLICSFRTCDQIIKIERGTGRIIWRLGGVGSDFALTSDQIFLRQHDISLTDNGQTLMFFDNGDSVRQYSRVVEMQLDETSKTITSFKALTLPSNYYGAYQGSVQKFGSYYFVCTGYNPYILKTTETTPDILFSKHLNSVSYRAYLE